MPKPKNETWQTCATPATPLQRGAFLDLCTEWLVSDPEHAPAVLDPRTCVEPPATHFDRQPFARTPPRSSSTTPAHARCAVRRGRTPSSPTPSRSAISSSCAPHAPRPTRRRASSRRSARRGRAARARTRAAPSGTAAGAPAEVADLRTREHRHRRPLDRDARVARPRDAPGRRTALDAAPRVEHLGREGLERVGAVRGEGHARGEGSERVAARALNSRPTARRRRKTSPMLRWSTSKSQSSEQAIRSASGKPWSRT